jgi:FkbM family methyltransferase
MISGPILDARGLQAVAGLLERPIHAVDVGCREGVPERWRALGAGATLVGFDADSDECARLNAAAISTQERYEPIALSDSEGTATLYLTADPQSASLYPPNLDAVRRHPELARHEPHGTVTVATTTLDRWAESAHAAPIDILKIDVQGAELNVLRGAQASLPAVRALELEVEFQPLYAGQPLFADVDIFLREHDFVLWRLRDLAHCGLTHSRRDERAFPVGDAVEKTRIGGQISWGNAIYVRAELGDPDSARPWQTSARDACVAAVLDLPELTLLALERAAAGTSGEPRRILARELQRARARANSRRLHGLFWEAPRHVRGFVGARARPRQAG